MNDVWIVCVAEVRRRLRSRAYQIGVVVGMLGIAVMIRLPAMLQARVAEDQTRIAIAGPPELTAPVASALRGTYTIVAVLGPRGRPTVQTLHRLHVTRLLALAPARRSFAATLYVSSTQNPNVASLQRDLGPLNLALTSNFPLETTRRLLAVPIAVVGVGDTFATPASATVAHALAFGLLFVLYLVVILNSQLTLNSVIEEKTNRIAELLVAAIDPLALLYGKIGAGTVLATVQLVAWLLAAMLSGVGLAEGSAMIHGGAALGGVLHDAIKPLVIPGFLFLLFLGLLQFSTMYAAIGSLVSRPEELGSIASALILPIFVAFVTAFVALDAPDTPFVVVASFVPLIAPFVMFVRIAVGATPLWQFLLSGTINLAFLAFVAIAAGRLYRVGMLLYGRPPSLRQIWSTIRG
ncbi:MAG TPA: ABC transporter permease [Candidatus Acidoferrales bacterium]|nr:ABC transporter permease [Candidatus Acidoferrales bacterium]